MGPARRGGGLPDPTAVKEATDPASGGRCGETSPVFVLVGGLMAVGAGMVIPFYNVYLTTLGADATTVGYVYALGGLSAAAHRAVGAGHLATSRFALRRGGRAVVDRAVLPRVDPGTDVAARGRGPHRAADEHLDGLADRLDLHRRGAAAAGQVAGLWFAVGGVESRLLRGQPGGRFSHRPCRVRSDVSRSDLLHRAGDGDLRRLLQPTPPGALGRAEQRLPRWQRSRPPWSMPQRRHHDEDAAAPRLSRRRSAAVCGCADSVAGRCRERRRATWMRSSRP